MYQLVQQNVGIFLISLTTISFYRGNKLKGITSLVYLNGSVNAAHPTDVSQHDVQLVPASVYVGLPSSIL